MLRIRISSAAASAALAAMLLAGCASSADPAVPVTPTANPNLVPIQFIQEPPPELIRQAGVDPELVKPAIEAARELKWQYYEADGVTQAAACTGSGGPTVVFSNGLIVPAAWTWGLIAKDLSRTNRVCMFDRPGTGLSVRRPESAKPNGPEANAREMFALLKAMGEPGPYILAGWSYGGMVVSTAATMYPTLVVGLELIDAVTPDAYRTVDRSGWIEGNQDLDMKRGEQIVGEGPKLGAKPVVVLVAGKGSALQRGDELAVRVHTQTQTAHLSSNSIHGVVKESAHTIPQQFPQAIVAATRAISVSANSGKPMPTCPPTFPASGITCQ